jgi:hypothetical protein
MFAASVRMIVPAAPSASAFRSREPAAALYRRKAFRLGNGTLLWVVFLCAITILLSGCGGSGGSNDSALGSSKDPGADSGKDSAAVGGTGPGPSAGAGPADPVEGGDNTLAVRPSHLSVAKEGDLVTLTRALVRQRAELRKSGALEPYSESIFRLETATSPGNPTPSGPALEATAGAAASGAAATGAAAAGDTPPRSGTTVQEAGVEEDDLLKTDGRMVYGLQRAGWGPDGRVRPDRVHAFRRQKDGSVEPTGTLDLVTDPATYTSLRGMVLAENEGRLALFGEANSWLRQFPVCPPGQECATPLPAPVSNQRPVGGTEASIAIAPPLVYSAPKTTLQRVDVSGAKPIAGSRLVIDGRLVGIR